MTVKFPSQDEIEEALEWYLAEHGPCRRADVFEPLANHFHLTTADRAVMLDNGKDSVWHNKVSWARKALQTKGRLAKSQHGVWELVREQEGLAVAQESTKQAAA